MWSRGMMYYGNGGLMGFGLGWIFNLLFWVAIVILAVVLFKKVMNHTDREKGSGMDPVEILKQRYAKGEIDKKQFEEMKKDLK